MAAGPPRASFQCMDDEQPGPSWAVRSVCSGHTVLDYDEVEDDSLEEGEEREEEALQLMDEMEWWGREGSWRVGGASVVVCNVFKEQSMPRRDDDHRGSVHKAKSLARQQSHE
ncbi:hypothetical protein NDU88_002005 [Pleurodeles waltl]|uniref:Uncharacterized protein n=1 Tax=Pleurodeles waltl TaxID=8319 RepID=A0AAV7U9J4_PLEWA|nr:hypothetical protein NDU88_002005 [Pleurodeles waltl]